MLPTPDISPNKTYLRSALLGGGIAAAVSLGAGTIVGVTSGVDVRLLLEASMPTVRFLASAVVTASATTLALILTLLGLSANTDLDVDPGFYRRLWRIAQVDVATFVGSIVLLVMLVIPFGEEAGLSSTFYTVAYYTLATASALTSGLLVAVVLGLYNAATDLIETCWLDGDAILAKDAEEEAEEAADRVEA
ncbi:hypothetical protein [Rubricoccus marinus]|uniref:Uncharacterized protein n=1 Tax=Rubricoccus marinus TaxID=716817 RepID=A0A259U362_9BACT|nr:hypothetical protein [Rubricoccus marinus]OZC04426.1 hypothetical protein BSZ36_16420 [Rubricoccus marinus]